MALINVKVIINRVDYATIHKVDSAAATPLSINEWVLDAPTKKPQGRIWKMIRLKVTGPNDIPIDAVNCIQTLDYLGAGGQDCLVEFVDWSIF